MAESEEADFSFETDRDPGDDYRDGGQDTLSGDELDEHLAEVEERREELERLEELESEDETEPETRTVVFVKRMTGSYVDEDGDEYENGVPVEVDEKKALRLLARPGFIEV